MQAFHAEATSLLQQQQHTQQSMEDQREETPENPKAQSATGARTPPDKAASSSVAYPAPSNFLECVATGDLSPHAESQGVPANPPFANQQTSDMLHTLLQQVMSQQMMHRPDQPAGFHPDSVNIPGLPGSTKSWLDKMQGAVSPGRPSPPGRAAKAAYAGKPDVITKVGEVVGNGVESVAKTVGNLLGPIPAYNGPCVCRSCVQVLNRLRWMLFDLPRFGPKEINDEIDDRFCFGERWMNRSECYFLMGNYRDLIVAMIYFGQQEFTICQFLFQCYDGGG